MLITKIYWIISILSSKVTNYLYSFTYNLRILYIAIRKGGIEKILIISLWLCHISLIKESNTSTNTHIYISRERGLIISRDSILVVVLLLGDKELKNFFKRWELWVGGHGYITCTKRKFCTFVIKDQGISLLFITSITII